MSATEMLEKIGESLGSTATVKSVFGEPIQTGGKTVVPVAKVSFGFGAGGGTHPKHGGDGMSGDAEGGGGGGGVRAYPAGALEISPTQTRFIPFADFRLLAGVFAAGALIGTLFARRGR